MTVRFRNNVLLNFKRIEIYFFITEISIMIMNFKTYFTFIILIYYLTILIIKMSKTIPYVYI